MAQGRTAPKDPSQVQVIGLCRFSYLGMGGFKVLHDGSLDERRAMLYDPSRLEARLVWFEHVFLPGLREQTDPDFTMIILTGKDLPVRVLSKLHALTEPLSQFRLVTREPGPHRDVCAEVVSAEIKAPTTVVAQFRLDDDDAVAVDYVEMIRRDYLLLGALFVDSGMMAVDYSQGMVLEDIGGKIRADRRQESFWGCGLTLYLNPESTQKVLNYPHHKIWHHMPTVVRGDTLMWVRGAHQSNDSKFRRTDPETLTAQEKMQRQLRSRFRIELGAMEMALAESNSG